MIFTKHKKVIMLEKLMIIASTPYRRMHTKNNYLFHFNCHRLALTSLPNYRSNTLTFVYGPSMHKIQYTMISSPKGLIYHKIKEATTHSLHQILTSCKGYCPCVKRIAWEHTLVYPNNKSIHSISTSEHSFRDDRSLKLYFTR